MEHITFFWRVGACSLHFHSLSCIDKFESNCRMQTEKSKFWILENDYLRISIPSYIFKFSIAIQLHQIVGYDGYMWISKLIFNLPNLKQNETNCQSFCEKSYENRKICFEVCCWKKNSVKCVQIFKKNYHQL